MVKDVIIVQNNIKGVNTYSNLRISGIMKTKIKFILSIMLLSVISLASILGIIAIMASFKTASSGSFKVGYKAQNVHAEVSAVYAIVNEPENSALPTNGVSLEDEFNYVDGVELAQYRLTQMIQRKQSPSHLKDLILILIAINI